MSTQKKTIKVLMFLLPAIVSLLAYTAFHEMLFRKPPCLINCDQPSMFSDNEKIKKWLAYLESLRNDAFNTQPSNKRTSPTPLDIAFLKDKINLASNDRDYPTRYQQIISDLSNPYIVDENDVGTTDNSSQADNVAPLVYMEEDETGNQFPYVKPDPTPTPGLGPFIIPGPSPLGPDETKPLPPITGPGNPLGNPVSSVPTPKSVYLVLGLVAVIGIIRFRVLQRTNILRF